MHISFYKRTKGIPSSYLARTVAQALDAKWEFLTIATFRLWVEFVLPIRNIKRRQKEDGG